MYHYIIIYTYLRFAVYILQQKYFSTMYLVQSVEKTRLAGLSVKYSNIAHYWLYYMMFSAMALEE